MVTPATSTSSRAIFISRQPKAWRMIYQIRDHEIVPIGLIGYGVRKMLLRDQSIAPWQNHKWAAFLTSRAGEHFLAYYGSQQEARTAAQKALGRPPYLAAYKPPQTPSKGPAT